MDPLDPKVDSFLAELPLAPLPAGFTRRVMKALPSRQAHPLPKFRLEFLDLAIPTFTALFASLVFAILAVFAISRGPLEFLRLGLEIQPLLWRLPDGLLLTAGAFLGGALLLSAVLLAGLTGFVWKDAR
jgi:hypothetical protein